MSRIALINCIAVSLIGGNWSPAWAASPKGTKIVGTKNAEIIREIVKIYDWELEKVVPPSQVPYVIPIGEHEFADFSIVAIRRDPVIKKEDKEVRGSVCISNIGKEKTKGLQILDRLEALQNGRWVGVSPWAPIPGITDILPGQRSCFPYEIEVKLDNSGKYRNHAIASIQNAAGVRPAPGAISIYSDVSVRVVKKVRGDEAKVIDTFQCPEGFVCTPETQAWKINQSTVIPFEVKITNASSPCGSTMTVINRAKLKPSDTKYADSDRTATAAITIFTGSCEGTVLTTGD
jgi:hypothetical protein